MKRVGNLLEQIAAPENLRLAFWKAAKGKWSRPATRAFAENFEEQIARMSEGLLDGNFPFRNYRRFRVFDPKERVIHAAAFSERVAHHGILNVCEPVLEKAAVFDSYACRKGKGRLQAIARAQGFTRRHRWFLKINVRRYFDSISHERLLGLLARKFKDRGLWNLLERIIRSYEASPGRGLPIGSLTSQHFANFYLGGLDRWALEWQSRVTCLLAVVRQAESFGFRHSAGIWQELGGDQPARTVSCGVATGTTTRTTRGARSATTIIQTTQTTTSASAWPERDLVQGDLRPEDAPVSVPTDTDPVLAKSKGPAGASRSAGMPLEPSSRCRPNFNHSSR